LRPAYDRLLRLATWNVNSLTARLPRVLELLSEHAPDIASLQETKVSDAAFPEAELRQAGYASVHHSAGRWAGVAVLAREEWPLERPGAGLPGEPVATEARWIEATVGGLRVASVYVPNGRSLGSPTFEQKLAFLDAMGARAPELDVILGDFNVAPADLDVYDPAAFVGSTHVTEDERSRVGALLDGGFVDAFRRLHPEEVGYTWWDYRAGHFHRRMGLRIDLALLRAPLAERLMACTVQRAFRKGPKPSDHAPLIVELSGAA
jgi:exodeoxyribonuclease-3